MHRLFPALFALTLLVSCRTAPPTPIPSTDLPRDSVTVITDRWGIPHVFAADAGDLYYGFGWVTARDRLWQLEVQRRAIRGQMWEWFGNAELRSDGGAQLFEFERRAQENWERDRGDEKTRVAIEAYTAGVNAYIAECRRGEHPWPPELRKLGKEPEAWRPEDAELALYELSMLLDFALPELTDRDALARFGAAELKRRDSFERDLMYRTIPDSAAARLYPANATRSASVSVPTTFAAEVREQFGRWLVDRDEQRASDIFAAGPGRTRNRKPVFANDPHLPLTMPGAFHVVHLSAPGVMDVIGAAVPGLPSIVSGRSEHCAWGVTALSADMMDVYADTLSADGKSVRWNGEWVPLRTEPFSMRFQIYGDVRVPPLGQARRYAPRGPVLIHDPKHRIAYTLRWAALEDTLTLRCIVGIENSTNATDLARCVRALRSPGINFIIADTDGRVIYQTAGAMPLRGFDPPPGPLPGDGRHEWQRILRADEMPAWQAPRDGFVANGNNLPAQAPGLENWPGFEWAQDRAVRIASRLAGDRDLTLADMASIQNDVFSRGAERLLPRLLHAIDSLPDRVSPRGREALDTLRAWNYFARRGLVAPTLYRAWVGALSRRHGISGSGLLAAALDGRAPEALAFGGAPADTSRYERAADAAAAALDTALVRLEKLLGPDLATWTYGRAHRARFAHEMGRAFEPPGIAMDGDNSTPSVGRSNLPWSTTVTHGPAFRHIVDLAQPETSYGVVVPGVQGDSSTPHPRDMLPRWANHRYVPFLMNRAAIEREQESRVVLKR
jgi:penicillin amidase